MATSPNIGLDLPARGSNVGVWDTPVNGDFTIIDSVFGGVTTLALSSANVTLSSSQAQNSIIRLTGTLNAIITITMASIYKGWTIDNQILNSASSFCASFLSTSGTVQLGVPPGQTDIFYDGTNLRYRNMGKLGEYWDYAGTTVPNWVQVCTVPSPWLNCNGSAFSSAIYPQLANLLGTTTLPDSRGRNRFALNQGTARLSSAGAGIDGNTAFAVGGNNGITLASSQIPTITSSGTMTVTLPSSLPSATFGYTSNGDMTVTAFQSGTFVGVYSPGNTWKFANSLSGANSMTYTNSSQAIVQATTPGYVGGITMIKAI